MHRHKLLMLAIAAFAAVAGAITAPRGAPAAVFTVKPGAPNKVVFVSTAAMEKFEGKTNQMQGRIEVDPAQLGDSVTVHLEVDLASLDTGLAKRNQHMREHHLETATYPKAVFDGATLSHSPGLSLIAGPNVGFEADGTFTLHGVSRRIRVHIDATYHAGAGGGSIDFKTQFPVTLGDYNISRPEFLFLKLAETQDVHVSGTATAGP